MVGFKFIEHAVAVERAARRVAYLALWLRDAGWPIPFDDVARVVRDLEQAARACRALPAPSDDAVGPAPDGTHGGREHLQSAARALAAHAGRVGSLQAHVAVATDDLKALIAVAQFVIATAAAELANRRERHEGVS